MELEEYNRTFEEYVETFEEDINQRLKQIRQQCYQNFVERFNSSQKEWDDAFRELLIKSQEDDVILKKQNELKTTTNSLFAKSDQANDSGLHGTLLVNSLPVPTKLKENVKPEDETTDKQVGSDSKISTREPIQTSKSTLKVESKLQQAESDVKSKTIEEEFKDPHFSNISAIKEFFRLQKFLETTRKSVDNLNTDANFKSYKNQLNLFIRTQINSISNSDIQHINTKTKLLTHLFTGQKVYFQDNVIDATQHPQAQLFSMDLAAQTFVTVGTRLVNSVPAIAKSMATVINGIKDNNLPIFKDLVVGHLLERCPYLIPLHPRLNDIEVGKDQEMKYKVACGYCFDSKTQSLETEEKYLARMRSFALIYACILVQGHTNQAWSWLAAFLSLKPQPVITATILQAFLQESSKDLSSTFGCQYKKVITFIRIHYLKMIEAATESRDRQSFIKLKNLLFDDTNLLAAPKVSSIFGSIKMG